MHAVHVSPYVGTWYPDCRTDLERLLDDLFETSAQRTGAFLFANPRSEEHTSELQSLRHLVCRLPLRSEEHTSELQSLRHLVCRLLLEKNYLTSTTRSSPASSILPCFRTSQMAFM